MSLAHELVAGARMVLMAAGATILVSGGVGLWMINRESAALHQSMYDEDAAWEAHCRRWDEARAERDRLHPELAGTVFSLPDRDDYDAACHRTDAAISRLRAM